MRSRFLELNLLRNIKKNHSRLKRLLDSVSKLEEDGVYRFYHQSFKVFDLQWSTAQMVDELEKVSPVEKLNEWFRKIVDEGVKKQFSPECNEKWPETARPIIEAFFHAKYFLEMAVRYGELLDESFDGPFPSGWAALLHLYDLQ